MTAAIASQEQSHSTIQHNTDPVSLCRNPKNGAGGEPALLPSGWNKTGPESAAEKKFILRSEAEVNVTKEINRLFISEFKCFFFCSTHLSLDAKCEIL